MNAGKVTFDQVRNAERGFARQCCRRERSRASVSVGLYFLSADIRHEFFDPRAAAALCGWDGRANYFIAVIAGVENRRAAWYDAAPEAARL